MVKCIHNATLELCVVCKTKEVSSLRKQLSNILQQLKLMYTIVGSSGEDYEKLALAKLTLERKLNQEQMHRQELSQANVSLQVKLAEFTTQINELQAKCAVLATRAVASQQQQINAMTVWKVAKCDLEEALSDKTDYSNTLEELAKEAVVQRNSAQSERDRAIEALNKVKSILDGADNA